MFGPIDRESLEKLITILLNTKFSTVKGKLVRMECRTGVQLELEDNPDRRVIRAMPDAWGWVWVTHCSSDMALQLPSQVRFVKDFEQCVVESNVLRGAYSNVTIWHSDSIKSVAYRICEALISHYNQVVQIEEALRMLSSGSIDMVTAHRLISAGEYRA